MAGVAAALKQNATAQHAPFHEIDDAINGSCPAT